MKFEKTAFILSQSNFWYNIIWSQPFFALGWNKRSAFVGVHIAFPQNVLTGAPGHASRSRLHLCCGSVFSKTAHRKENSEKWPRSTQEIQGIREAKS